MSSYTRVIPRDLFNEASLLKCYGRLAILLEKTPGNKACFRDEAVPEFKIVQDPSDGSIRVDNLPLFIGRRKFRLIRPLNARDPWPLWIESYEETEKETYVDPIAVFDQDGDLSKEFQDLVT